MKRFLSLILVATLVLSLSFIAGSTGFGVITEAEEPSYRPQVVDLTTRKDFGFGVNVHSSGYAAYPEAYLEEQIHAVAKLGSKYIRINLAVPEDGNWTYYDSVVGLCNKYGLKIVATASCSRTMGLDYITLYFDTLATRYNGEDGRGFVDYFQAWNEIDIVCMRAKYGNSSTRGDSESHYYNIPVDGLDNDLPEWFEYFEAAEKGVHCKEGNSKFIVNYAATHHGFITYMLRNGLKLDAVGWDEYTYYPYDLEKSAKTLEEYLDQIEKDIYKKYKVPVIVCETNVYTAATPQNERENPTYETHEALIDYMYMYYNRPWIKAAIFYELLDEIAFGMDNQESWFGLIKHYGGGVIEEENEKPIYKAIQRLLKGDPDMRVIDRSELDLEPYKKLIVDTADDSNIDKGDKNDNSSEIIESIPEIDWETEPEIEIEDTVVSEPENETKVEEVIVENVITPVKDVKTKETSYKLPWGFVIGVGAGLLVLAAAIVAAYLYFSKKKALK